MACNAYAIKRRCDFDGLHTCDWRALGRPPAAAAGGWPRGRIFLLCLGGLGGGCGLDLFELGFVEAFGFPEIEFALGIEPELGAVAEEAGEAEGHGRA
jgi:hypothetical protein